jgi:predicted amidophosphoribosyltransferase
MPWLRAGCPRCGLPAHRGRPCPAARAAFDRAWSPLAYAGPAAALVRAMAAAIAARLPPELHGLPLVPVPPQRARARRRGYDPADLLAARAGARLGVPVERCLRRTDHGRRHTRLGRGERHAGAPDVIAQDPPAQLVLLDDVHTTGATLHACARALKAAGAARVAAVTYARTL